MRDHYHCEKCGSVIERRHFSHRFCDHCAMLMLFLRPELKPKPEQPAKES